MATTADPDEPTIVRKGWCEKHGKKNLRHVWKRRLLILLSNHELAYFENENHDNQREVDLAGATDIEGVATHDDREFCFDILLGDQHRLSFSVASEQERNEWVFDIRNAMTELHDELAEREALERQQAALERAMSAEPPPAPKRRQSWWNRAKDTDASGIEHASPTRRKSLKQVFGRRASFKNLVSPRLSSATPNNTPLRDGDGDEQDSGARSNSGRGRGLVSSLFRSLTPEPSGDEDGGGGDVEDPLDDGRGGTVMAPPPRRRPDKEAKEDDHAPPKRGHRKTFSLLRGKSSSRRSHTPDPHYATDTDADRYEDDANPGIKRRISGMFGRSRTPEPKKREARAAESIVEAKMRENNQEPMTIPMSFSSKKRTSVTLNDLIEQAQRLEASQASRTAPATQTQDGMPVVSGARRLSDFFRTGGFGDVVDEIKMSPNQLQTLVEELDEDRSKLQAESSALHQTFQQAEMKRQKSEKLVSSLEQTLASRGSEVEKLQAHLEERERIISQLRTDYGKQERHMHELTSRLGELEGEASRRRLESENAIKHEREMKQENDRLEERLRVSADRLAQEKQARIMDVQNANEQVERLKSEMKLLRQVSDDAQAREAQFRHMRLENENLTTQLRDLQSRLDVTVQSKDERILEMHETIKNLNARLLSGGGGGSGDSENVNESSSSELMRQLRHTELTNRELRGSVESYVVEIEGLRRQVNHAKSDAQRYQNELIEVQSRMTAQIESIKAREVAWERIERETRVENEELKTQVERHELEISKLKRSVHNATKKYKHLRHQSSVDNASLRTELHVAQQERRRHQRMESVEMDSINKLTIEAEQLRSEKRKLEEKMKTLQTELVAKQEVWHRVWRQLSNENEILKKEFAVPPSWNAASRVETSQL